MCCLVAQVVNVHTCCCYPRAVHMVGRDGAGTCNTVGLTELYPMLATDPSFALAIVGGLYRRVRLQSDSGLDTEQARWSNVEGDSRSGSISSARTVRQDGF